MSFRILVLSKRAKVELQMNHLVVRYPSTDNKRVHLGELDAVLVESTNISITSALLAELVNHKIRVVFCDAKHNPVADLLPCYGAHDCAKKVFCQTQWKEDLMAAIWQEIIRRKIKKQRSLLCRLEADEQILSTLQTYIDEVQLNDATNREAVAAKAYFQALFGLGFTRNTNTTINAGLNYGYQVLCSMVAHEIKLAGYLTELGIFHRSQHNPFNLASDLMEIFRPHVDEIVHQGQWEVFGKEEKYVLQQLPLKVVEVQDKKYELAYIVRRFVVSVCQALTGNNMETIRWPDEE